MSDFNYTNIVSTIGALGTLFLIGWNIFTWIKKKKNEETPVLKICGQCCEMYDTHGRPRYDNFISIQNIGKCGVTIQACEINRQSVDKYAELKNGYVLINAVLQRQASIRCMWIRSRGSRIQIGDLVDLTYRSDFGKIYHNSYTLSMENI